MVSKLIANIYVLGKYTKRATKSKGTTTFAGLCILQPLPILLALNTASRNTCLLKAHVAFRIPVIRKRI